jgi:hypothetical protein
MTEILATGDVVHRPGGRPVVGFDHVLPPEPGQVQNH